MTYSVADLVALICALISLYAAVSNGRKTRAEVKSLETDAVKTHAEAVNTYADAAAKMATLSKECHEEISALSEKLDARDKRIEELEHSISELSRLLEAKDARIAELERLNMEHETEIRQLQDEISILRRRRAGSG